MSKFKVIEGSWKGQVGEFVREEAVKVVETVEGELREVEKAVAVLRMPGSRLVEFKAEHVEAVAGEPEAEAPKAAE